MTLQWTFVAFFLYAEIAVHLILCLPFISAKRWRSVFNWSIWNWLTSYWNKVFLTMIIILLVLFLDALREVTKYSASEPMMDANLHPNLFDHLQMKLFRAQRNLYISGFSLFLWLILRRVVALLNQMASASDSSANMQALGDTTSQAAKKYQDGNLVLRQALLDEEKSSAANKELWKSEVVKLSAELKTARNAVLQSQAEVESMKRQSEGLTQEYERLLSEHQQLQIFYDSTGQHQKQKA